MSSKEKTALSFSPKIKKKLVFPVLKMEQDEPIYFKSVGEIYVGKEIVQDGKAKQKPADLMPVVDLVTGEEMLIVVPAVVKGVLREEYPDAKYVGLCFVVTKGEKMKDRYFLYSIAEIEDPTNKK